MEKKSNSKKVNVFQIILCIAVVALIVTVFIQGRIINSHNKSVVDASISENTILETSAKDKTVRDQVPVTVNKIRESAEEINNPVEKVNAPQEKEISELEYQLDASEEELDMATKQLVDELDQKKDFKTATAQLQKKLLSDPALKKVLRNSFKKNLDKNYDPLLKFLDVSPEEFDELKGILADRMMEVQSIAPMMLEASSKDEREELNWQIVEANDKSTSKIRELLGEDKNRVYQSYAERLSERNSLNDFMESLPSEQRLSEDQREILINSMYEARKTTQAEMGLVEGINSPADLTEEKLAQVMEKQVRLNEKYLEASSDILPPGQTEQFKKYLQQKLDMTESTLKMSLHLYGGNTD